MSDLNITVEPTEPVTIEDVAQANIPSDNGELINEVEKFFGVDAGTPTDVRDRLKVITEVVSHDSKDISEALEKIKMYQRKIGVAYFGNEAINRIFNYAKLVKNRYDAEKMMKAYEVNDGSE